MSVSNSKNNLPMESSNWNVVKRDGSKEAVSFDKVLRRLNKLAHSPDGKKLKVDVMELAQRVISSIYDGVETWQLDKKHLKVVYQRLQNILIMDYLLLELVLVIITKLLVLVLVK